MALARRDQDDAARRCGCAGERRDGRVGADRHDRPARRPSAARANSVGADVGARCIALAPQRVSRRSISEASIVAGATISTARPDRSGGAALAASAPSAGGSGNDRTEARAFARRAFDLDAAAHALDDAPRDGEAEAGAAELAGRCRRRPARTRGRCAPARSGAMPMPVSRTSNTISPRPRRPRR